MTLASGLDAEAFWKFSLVLYRTPGVESACLALQDREGLNVNFLLFAAFLGCRGYRLTEEINRRLLAETETWREHVVRPLRDARRATPGDSADSDVLEFRRRLKELEIESERIDQHKLIASAQSLPASPIDDQSNLAMENLLSYVACLGKSVTSECRADLGILGAATTAC